MRRTTTVLAVALMLLSVLAAHPAAAAPAEPFNVNYCIPFPDGSGGNTAEYCVQSEGVVHSHETPSGNTQFTANARTCSQVTLTGQTLTDSCSKRHFTLVERDGERQVRHVRETTETTFFNPVTGETTHCTVSYNIVHAHGELRHEDQQIDCHPV